MTMVATQAVVWWGRGATANARNTTSMVVRWKSLPRSSTSLIPQGNRLEGRQVHRLHCRQGLVLFPNAAELRKTFGQCRWLQRDCCRFGRSGYRLRLNWPEAAKQPDADPFDLLCHFGPSMPLLRTRRERAEWLRTERKDFFDKYSPRSQGTSSTTFWKNMPNTARPSSPSLTS